MGFTPGTVTIFFLIPTSHGIVVFGNGSLEVLPYHLFKYLKMGIAEDYHLALRWDEETRDVRGNATCPPRNEEEMAEVGRVFRLTWVLRRTSDRCYPPSTRTCH